MFNSSFTLGSEAVKTKQVVSIMADIDLNNADVRDMLNEIICFFVSCLDNLVSNLSYEYKNDFYFLFQCNYLIRYYVF